MLSKHTLCALFFKRTKQSPSLSVVCMRAAGVACRASHMVTNFAVCGVFARIQQPFASPTKSCNPCPVGSLQSSRYISSTRPVGLLVATCCGLKWRLLPRQVKYRIAAGFTDYHVGASLDVPMEHVLDRHVFLFQQPFCRVCSLLLADWIMATWGIVWPSG